MSESKLLHEVMLAAPDLGCRLLRNNVGVLRDIRGNYVRYGLGVGSSDAIGWTKIIIEPKMLGAQVAIFTAVETKSKGKKPNAKQYQFIDAVRDAGGIATVAYCEADLELAIYEYQR